MNIDERLSAIVHDLNVLDGHVLHYADGGYPLYYIDSGHNILCPDCMNHDIDNGEMPTGYGINYEVPDLYCDACSKRIKSAYVDND